MKGNLNLKFNYRIGLVIFVVSILCLYLLISMLNVNKNNKIKQERFGSLDDTTPDLIFTTTAYTMPTIASIHIEQNSANTLYISEGIASLLGISTRRVKNLQYANTLKLGQLDISFIIDEPNFLENHTGAITTENAQKTLNNLLATHMFKIKLNGTDIMLNKLTTELGTSSSTKNNESSNVKPAVARYFDNTALLNIADHAKKTYDSVPYDDSVTKFFKLSIDPVYNIHIDPPYTS